MTPGPVLDSPAAGAGWLLRLGTRAAVSAWVPVLALAGVLAMAQAIQRMFWPSLFLGDPALRLEGTLLVAGGGCLVASVLARAVVTAIGVGTGRGTAPDRSRSGGSSGHRRPPGRRLGRRGGARGSGPERLVLGRARGERRGAGARRPVGVAPGEAAGFALSLTLGILLGPRHGAVARARSGGVGGAPGAHGRGGRRGAPAPPRPAGVPRGAWPVPPCPPACSPRASRCWQPGRRAGAVRRRAAGVALLLVALVEALATLVRSRCARRPGPRR